jgi:hypothetical protein
VKVKYQFHPYSSGNISWVDFDNDKYLDIIYNGYSSSAHFCDILVKDINIKNTAPGAPANLTSLVAGSSATLSWDKASDTETPQSGLSYNLYIGSSPGLQDIYSSNAEISTGQLRIAKRGKLQSNSVTINHLKGGPYYWGVQSIDAGYLGSTFSSQASFSITQDNSIAPANAQTLITGQSGNILSVTELSVPDSRKWKYAINPGGPYLNEITGETNTTLTPKFYQSGVFYIVCVSKFGNIEVISNEVEIDVQQFTEISPAIPFENLAEGDAAWGDYNNDGFIDMLLTGSINRESQYDPTFDSKSLLYRNNGDGSFTLQTSIPLTGVIEGSCDWGDFDNDGFLDILLTGTTNGSFTGAVAKIYHKMAIIPLLKLRTSIWLEHIAEKPNGLTMIMMVI